MASSNIHIDRRRDVVRCAGRKAQLAINELPCTVNHSSSEITEGQYREVHHEQKNRLFDAERDGGRQRD
jgi:hypothetical protein